MSRTTELWAPLDNRGFPGYSISSYGQVRNDNNGRMLSQSKNNTGYMKTGLNDSDGVRRTVEIVRLVAEAFLPGYSEDNNTPIHLDGNKEHTFVDNLAWRPRWFAAKYHSQFRKGEHLYHLAIVELESGQVFDDSHAAAKAFGVLARDVILSTANHTPVFPGGWYFRLRD